MSAPHVTGIAALIRQKFPHFTPAAIGSALSTTASLSDRKGEHIMAQRAVLNPDSQSPATPFDMGSGFVNATAALDPGLIFDIGKRFLEPSKVNLLNNPISIIRHRVHFLEQTQSPEAQIFFYLGHMKKEKPLLLKTTF